MSKRKTPTDETLLRERKSGLSGAEIGRKYKVSKVCVCKHLRRLGINSDGKGKNHSGWKGGRGIKTGYMTVYKPEHHRANNIRRVFEHILIMEEILGRKIKKGEPIHHIDLDRLNNDPKNLYLFSSHSEHQKSHTSIDECVKILIKKGIIKFSKGRYHL